MIEKIIKFLLLALVIVFLGWLIPGISVAGYKTALLVTVVLALINLFIRPIISFVTLPINIITLGLFSFVINALLLMLAAYWTPGFEVNGFWNALLGSVVLSFLSTAINRDYIGRE